MFKIKINILITFLLLLFTNTISYCVEISDVATTAIQEAQSTNSLFLIGVTLTSVTLGYLGYCLYKTYFKPVPPKPPLGYHGEFFEDPEITQILLNDNLNDNLSSSASSSASSSSEILLTPSNFDILSLGVSQLTDISNRMLENHRLYTQLVNTEFISRSMNDDLTDVTILLQSIQNQNIDMLHLLNDINQLYVLYLSGV